jgi:hypothetical protein
MYDYIWDSRRHVCEFTSKNLDQFKGTDLWFSCFAHILPKGKFPLFRLNEENVRLVYPMFHTIIDQGIKADREKHPDWDFRYWNELFQSMKESYMKFKKDNLLA